jgi:peptide/nickel transport system permease protein
MKRLAWAAFVIWATLTLSFVVNHALPSDPARMIAGQQAPPSAVAKLRAELGLDQPLATQYVLFLRRFVHRAQDPARASHESCASVGFAHLDLGRSYQQRRPVVTILAERAPRTFLLAIAAALVQALLGIVSGVLAAVFRQRPVSHIVRATSLLGISAPTFVIGLALQHVFAYELRWFPIDGYGETWGEHLRSLALPALTLGVFGAAVYTRLVREELLLELDRDYVRTARAKGSGEARVVVFHALRNALLPIVTVFGLELGTLFGGAIVTESIFRWPGLGSLSVNAMLDRDGPVILGCVLLTASVVVMANLAVDLLYGILDPRTRKR